MATFPKSETDILMLAEAMKHGLDGNAAVFPAPPIPATNLGALSEAYVRARDKVVAAEASLMLAKLDRDAALRGLSDAMKQDLRYAETVTNLDGPKLKLLGWDGRSAPTRLVQPGQPRLLEALQQGEGWLTLRWKAPADGGTVAVYTIQRRLRPDGPWLNVGTSMKREAKLTGQERGKEWEYHVVAMNKAGESMPSNTVMAVL